MEYIDWKTFDASLNGRFISRSKCPLRLCIYRQLDLIADTYNIRWALALSEAKLLTYVSSNTSADSIRDSLQKGKGSKELAGAIFYWIHSITGLEKFAEEIDKVAFRVEFQVEFPNYEFEIVNDIKELSGTVRPTSPDLEIPSADLNKLKNLIGSFEIGKQKYPSLVMLTIQIEEIMRRKCLHMPYKDGLYNFRYNFTLRKPWVHPDELIQGGLNAADWKVKLEGQPSFLKEIDGRKFALINKDQVRVDSDTLHDIDSWFGAISRLYIDKIIKPRDLDIFLRYLIVFASNKRGRYLQHYFNDDGEKFNIVLRLAVIRAAVKGINLRDYKQLDEDYYQLYKEYAS